MYTDPYLNPYRPIYAQNQPNFNLPQLSPQALPRMEVQRVNGEESARAYAIGPNSSVILLDNNEPLIWFVMTDASGYKTISAYDISPHVVKKPVTEADLKEQMTTINDRLDKIEERMNSYGQSNRGNTWKNKPGNGGNQSNDWNGQNGQGSAGSHQSAGGE